MLHVNEVLSEFRFGKTLQDPCARVEDPHDSLERGRMIRAETFLTL
jgi:hypothetical protein